MLVIYILTALYLAAALVAFHWAVCALIDQGDIAIADARKWTGHRKLPHGLVRRPTNIGGLMYRRYLRIGRLVIAWSYEDSPNVIE